MTDSVSRRETSKVLLYLLAFAVVAAIWILVYWTAPVSVVARWKGGVTSNTVILAMSDPSSATQSMAVGSSFDSPVTAATAPQAATTASVPRSSEYLPVSFHQLAGFRYDSTTTSIPETIRQLDRKQVSISGFMVPLDLDEKGKVRSFLLVKNQMLCCFGIFPGITDYIGVSGAQGFSTDYVTDQPVTVRGTLRVGEVRKEGELLGLYLMTCHAVN